MWPVAPYALISVYLFGRNFPSFSLTMPARLRWHAVVSDHCFRIFWVQPWYPQYPFPAGKWRLMLFPSVTSISNSCSPSLLQSWNNALCTDNAVQHLITIQVSPELFWERGTLYAARSGDSPLSCLLHSSPFFTDRTILWTVELHFPQ